MAKTQRQRTCVMCKTSAEKRDLMRIVRTPEGGVRFDATGKLAGRGAYVCSVACLEKALAARKLDAALRVKLSDEDTLRITESLRCALSVKKD